MKRPGRTVLASCIIIASVIIDQLSKLLAAKLLPGKGFVSVIGDAVGFELLHNEGAFMGMFSQTRWAFMIPSVIFIVAMCVWLWLKRKAHPEFVVSLSLLIGGGIGNMIDRLWLGYVIDFISVPFVAFDFFGRHFVFPVFNFADSCVTVGCVIFLISIFLPGRDMFDIEIPKRDKSSSSENGKDGTDS